jgi:CLIP-associating protein 1/2
MIHNVIKRGLSDADSDARSNARKAFGFFRDHFPVLADALLTSLDAAKKKTLLVSETRPNTTSDVSSSIVQGEMSNSSSTHSLASTGASRLRTAKE